jgi:predicted 2-oxoglutarate/Fe(II)-dependent dioxygenase YbiX
MTAALFVLPAAWDRAFCDGIRRAMDRGDAGDAEIVDGSITVDASVRRALDVTIDSPTLMRVERALARLRPRLAGAFQEPLTGSVGVTCLRYATGGGYRRHRDRDPRPGSGTEHRKVSVIVWLNSASSDGGGGEFGGGTLRLYEPDVSAAHELVPVAGTLVAFPSGWPHEVTPVTWGARDVVVDWWS